MRQDDALAYVRDLKADGKRIAMTNDCFDILRAGNLVLLTATLR